jgi:predicted CXXCH cytochrome family protein
LNRARSTTLLTVAAVAVVALATLLISCATVDRVVTAPPMIPGAKYVGMDQCALCHEKQVKNFKLTQHARVQLRDTTNKEEVKDLGCEACHGPGSLHVDAGGGKPKERFIISGKGPEACFQCHLDKNAEFSLQYHHPVKEARMNCTACHDPHGEDINKPKGMFVGRVNEVCAQCHREQARPHVFEHEALREGCTTCHNVHGSINPKMLTERDNNLCLKCHAQVASPALPGVVVIGKMPHAGFAPTDFLRQGTCFSAGCHTAVHGSDVNSHLRY